MSWIRGALVFLGPKEVDLSFSLRHDQGNIVFPTDAANANPDGGVAAPNANVRSCQETETDPDNGGSRLERPTTRGDHDQESGLGLAWRTTGPGVCVVSSTPAPFSFGAVDPDAGVPVAAPVKCLATAIDS
jgi:hypothetical protein